MLQSAQQKQCTWKTKSRALITSSEDEMLAWHLAHLFVPNNLQVNEDRSKPWSEKVALKSRGKNRIWIAHSAVCAASDASRLWLRGVLIVSRFEFYNSRKLGEADRWSQGILVQSSVHHFQCLFNVRLVSVIVVSTRSVRMWQGKMFKNFYSVMKVLSYQFCDNYDSSFNKIKMKITIIFMRKKNTYCGF